uniref:Uncharacterized protein n=1 Tax=Biomphalaria glabrata TaxID=6526 RepID=A0A2C9LQV5_BIOGL
MMANVNIEFTLRNGSKHNIPHPVDNEQCRLSLNSLKNSIIRVHEESNNFMTSIVNDEKAQCKFTEESQDNDGVSEDDSSEESDGTDEVIVEGKPPPLKKSKS